MICRIMRAENAGFTNRRFMRPVTNRLRAAMAQTHMPRQVPRAAPQMPKPNTNRKVNSSTALITDMRIFKNMLNRICPQIRR